MSACIRVKFKFKKFTFNRILIYVYMLNKINDYFQYNNSKCNSWYMILKLRYLFFNYFAPLFKFETKKNYY
jgi:hypothetical protein